MWSVEQFCLRYSPEYAPSDPPPPLPPLGNRDAWWSCGRLLRIRWGKFGIRGVALHTLPRPLRLRPRHRDVKSDRSRSDTAMAADLSGYIPLCVSPRAFPPPTNGKGTENVPEAPEAVHDSKPLPSGAMCSKKPGLPAFTADTDPS